MTEQLLRNREREPGDTLAIAAARSRAADVRQAREEADQLRDPDEYAANLVTKGYAPGQISQLSMKLADCMAELETQRSLIEKGRLRQERIRRDHDAGKITAFDIARMQDFDEGDAHRAEQLERRAESIRRQIAEAAEVLSPSPQRDLDPVEQASRDAHRVFAEITRMKREAAAGAPPQRRERPFASRASAGARDAEHTGTACHICAEGRRRDAAKSNPGPEITRARRLEDLGYGESSPDGCPPCDACHYAACRCSPLPRAAGEPQVYA